MTRAVLRLSFAFVALLFSPVALASDPFPETVRAQLNLATAPLCTLCHETMIGGLGTVIKPFGVTVQKKYGATMQDIQGLRNALMQMQVNGDDSDEDGVSDIAELLAGTDPNVPTGGVAKDERRYGCYCSSPGVRSDWSAAGAAWLSGFVLSGWRRRRRERET